MNRPAEVDAWIADLDPADRELYDIVEATILGTGLVDQIAYSYKLPTFKRGNLPVTVARWKGGISLSTREPEPIAAFKARNPQITGGKISVQLPRGTPIPVDDLTTLIKTALTAAS